MKNTNRKQLFLSFKEDFCIVVIGVQSWQQEDVFAKEPVRRMIVAFHYQIFELFL